MNRDKNKFFNYSNKTFNPKKVINEPTCFKLQNTSMIGFALNNHVTKFMKTAGLETGISDHHKMIFFISKHTFPKGPHKTTCYRDLKNFDQKAFISYLKSKNTNFENLSRHCTVTYSFDKENHSL